MPLPPGALFIFVFKIILLIVIVYGDVLMVQQACGGQRTTLEDVFCPHYGFGALNVGGQACTANAFGCRAMVPTTVSSFGAADLD